MRRYLLMLPCLLTIACAQHPLPDGPLTVELTAQATANSRLGLVIRTPAGKLAIQLTAQGASASGPGASASGPRTGWPAGPQTLRLTRLANRVELSDAAGELLCWPGALPGEGTLSIEKGSPPVEVGEAQPLEPPFAGDDFQRAEEDLGGWRAQRGRWHVAQYRDPLVARFKLPAQANWLAGQATDGVALALTGEPFWRDLAVSLDLRATKGLAGVVFGASERGYGLLRLNESRLELLRVTAAGEQRLAAAPVTLAGNAWVRLTVQSSGDLVRAAVDDQFALSARVSGLSSGQVGAWTSGSADFDNLAVRDATFCEDDFAASLPGRWQAVGEWRVSRGTASATATRQAATLTAPGLLLDDGEVTASIASLRGEAGVAMRDATTTWQLLTDGATWRLLRGGSVLASGKQPGRGAPQLQLRRRGALLQAAVNGQVQGVDATATAGLRGGAVVTRGSAAVDRLLVLATPRVVPTTLLRTAFDRDEVPGKGKSEVWKVLGDLLRPEGERWTLRHDDAERGPHLAGRPRGNEPIRVWCDAPPGDVGLQVSLLSFDRDATLDLLSGGGEGYALRLTAGQARLLRRGQEVARLSLTDPPARARLTRDSAWVVGEVDGQRLVWRDPEPLSSGRPGLRLSGGEVRLNEFEVFAENAVGSTFGVIDTAWREAGNWVWNSGMACIAWSYWITADARQQPALLWRREPLPRDLTVDFHVSESTDGYEEDQAGHDHIHYAYHDLSIVLDGDGRAADSGYRVLIGADGGRGIKLLRQGQVVAQNPRFRITMGGHCNEPRTIHTVLTRRGARLSLRLNGELLLDWSDPAPLAGGGCLALGAAGCRANFSDFVALAPAAGDGS
ncbi:MAG: hypothetical protein IT204_16545 [Fimbriimonadaceae bacterium]|nr:hypothetical protein [Fimbriimonadaceae bacterium]